MSKKFRELPLGYQRQVKNVLNSLANKSKKNEAVVFISETPEEVSIIDVEPQSTFYFKCKAREYIEGQQGAFELSYKPKSTEVLDEISFFVKPGDVIDRFNAWVNCIGAFSEFQESYNSYYGDNFNEFFDESVKDDTSFYTTKQQFILLEILIVTEEVLNMQDEIDNNLLNDVKYLQNNLQRLNKSETSKRFSELFSKIKFKSILILNTIIKKVNDVLSEKLIDGGLNLIATSLGLGG